MTPTFALVDCNNFYCSCERLFRPDLKRRPVAVLSNNDGCIIARSQEVKDLGVKMGTPLFQARALIEAHNIQVFSSNYNLYGDISQRVMQTLEELCPRVEIYSIDEAFLDLSGFSSLVETGRKIKSTVYKHVGIPVSIGMAPTKTLAKLANQAAKTYRATGGVVDLSDRQRQLRLLQRVPVAKVWGVGRRHARSLEKLGISSAYGLSRMHLKFARQRFSIVMERTVRELNGEACIGLEEIIPAKQQIVCSRSFGEKIDAYGPLRDALCEFTARALEKLRGEKQRATTLTVFIRTSPFDTRSPCYSQTATGSLSQASSDTRDFLQLATRLFDNIWSEGYRYAKAGVMLGGFSPAGQFQYPLFDPQCDTRQSDQLMTTVDRINHQGIGKVWWGGQQPERDWFMTQANRSPAYTTRWDAMPRVS